jgi:hypothetical protein
MNHTDSSTPNPTPKTPVSKRQATANRANAQRSTGPRTPQGKARSSLNALRHGILARAAFNLTIEGAEKRKEFEAIVAGLAQEFQPRTMTEHLTVQQLAGCYWRLAKVWTYETEGAWRANDGLAMPLEELNEWDEMDLQMLDIRNRLLQRQKQFFPAAGLGNPTIPNGTTARTILRYQGAINTMMIRCLSILERRRKERMQSEEAFEKLDYTNEPIEAPPSAETLEAEAPAAEASSEETAAPAKDAEIHKRTQKDATDAPLSSNGEVKSDVEPPLVTAPSDPNRNKTS